MNFIQETPSPLTFFKACALGNDFIIIWEQEEKLKTVKDLGALSKTIADRRLGIGCDQVIFVSPADKDDQFNVLFFNQDGSEAKSCGNGSRCVAKLLWGLKGLKTLTLLTKGGEVDCKIIPREAAQTPDQPAEKKKGKNAQKAVPGQDFLLKDVFAGNVDVSIRLKFELVILDEKSRKSVLNDIGKDLGRNINPNITFVNMGNPHLVCLSQNVEDALKKGPALEYSLQKPLKETVNVGFYKPLSGDKIILNVWERGAGPTMACGTGACAAVVAAFHNNLCYKSVTVFQKGGSANVTIENNYAILTGEANIIFAGSFVYGT